ARKKRGEKTTGWRTDGVRMRHQHADMATDAAWRVDAQGYQGGVAMQDCHGRDETDTEAGAHAFLYPFHARQLDGDAHAQSGRAEGVGDLATHARAGFA